MIIKRAGNKWILKSKATGHKLGTAKTKKKILKREKQVVFFKNLKKSSGGPGSLLSKVKKASLKRKIRR